MANHKCQLKHIFCIKYLLLPVGENISLIFYLGCGLLSLSTRLQPMSAVSFGFQLSLLDLVCSRNLRDNGYQTKWIINLVALYFCNVLYKYLLSTIPSIIYITPKTKQIVPQTLKKLSNSWIFIRPFIYFKILYINHKIYCLSSTLLSPSINKLLKMYFPFRNYLTFENKPVYIYSFKSSTIFI